MTVFTVYGSPTPQGSKKAFVVQGKGGKGPRAIVTEQAGDRLKAWRSDIRDTARMHFPQPITGPVLVELEFHMARPKAHYVANNPERPLKASAPMLHTGVPDADKLTRAVLDALTQSGIYLDDAQVCTGRWIKRYADAGQPAKTIIRVEPVLSPDDLPSLEQDHYAPTEADRVLRDIQEFVKAQTDPSRELVHGSMLHIARLLNAAQEVA